MDMKWKSFNRGDRRSTGRREVVKLFISRYFVCEVGTWKARSAMMIIIEASKLGALLL